MTMKGCWKCTNRPLRADESRLLCDGCSLLNSRLGSTDLATFGAGRRDTSTGIMIPTSSVWTEHAPDDPTYRPPKEITYSATTDVILPTGALHQAIAPHGYTGDILPDDWALHSHQGEFNGGIFDWNPDPVFAHGYLSTSHGDVFVPASGEVPLNPFDYHQALSLGEDAGLFLEIPQQLEPFGGVSIPPVYQQDSDARGKLNIQWTPQPSPQPERRSAHSGHSAPGLSYGQNSLYQALLSLEYTSDESTTHSSSTHDSSAGSPNPAQSWSNTGDATGSEDKDDDPDGIEIAICGVLPLDPRVESNSLPFLLQSYANWMKKMMFDPSRTAHLTRDWIIKRYTWSSQSDLRIVLVANILRAMVTLNAADYQPMLSMFTREIRQTLIHSAGLPLTTAPGPNATTIPALHLTLELNIFSFTSPLLDALQVLSDIAHILKRVYYTPTSQYIHLPSLLTHPDPNVRGYPAMDVLYSMLTGLPTKLKYDATSRLKPEPENTESLATRLIGQPYEMTMVLARISSLHDEFGVDVDPLVVEEIESDIRDFRPDPGISVDPSLTVFRLVVLEAWRQVGYINLYMRLCGESALGPRVQVAQRRIMELVTNTKSSHKLNLHLAACLGILGLVATRAEERSLVLARLQSLPHSKSECFLNRGIQMLQDIWLRTDSEGRPSQWSDLREATRRVVGI